MKIFIASSSEALPYASAMQSLLEETPDWEPVTWKDAEFDLSNTIIDSLEKIVSSYSFAVFIFYPDDETTFRSNIFKSVRDNVIFEYGLFAGAIGIKKCFMVVPGNVNMKVPTDISGVLYTTYKYESQDDNIRSTLRSSADRIKDAIKKQVSTKIKNERLIRGDFRDFIVDASLNVNLLENQLHLDWLNSMKKGEKVKEELLYWDRQTAQKWLEYEEFTLQSSYSLIRAIGDEIKKLVRGSFDFISLGPGSGQKDVVLLQSSTSSQNSYWYYPIDISSYLLYEALRKVTGEFDDSNLKVKGILANFDTLGKLKFVYRYTNHPNIFSLLGSTLGNYEESDFIRRIANAMVKDDLFILEVNNIESLLVDNPEKYQNKNYQGFILEPLRSLGIDPKSSNLKFEDSNSMPSSIPGSKRKFANYYFDQEEKDKLDWGVSKLMITYSTHYDMEKVIQFVESYGLRNVSKIKDVNSIVLQFVK